MTLLDRRMFLRRAAAVGGAVLLPSALAACGGSGSEEAVKSGPVNLQFWTHDPGYRDTFTKAAKMFQDSGDTDLEYKLTYVNADGDGLITRMISNAAAAGKDTPDMIGIIISTFNRLMTGNIAPSLLHDWSSDLEKYGADLLPSRVAPYTLDGKPYAIESDNCTTVLYYREDLFATYKIPADAASWEELADAGAKLYADAGKSLGIVCTGDDTSAANQFLQFLVQRGGNFFDEKGALAIESPEAVEVLTFMAEGVKSGFLLEVPDPYGPAMLAALKSEKIISVTMPDWYSVYALKTNLPEQKGKWRLTAMPRFAGGGTRAASLGGTGFGVMKDKKNTQAAIDLIKYAYLTEEGQVLRFKTAGYLPTLRSVYDNAELQAYKDDYGGGQQVFQVYRELAGEVPPFYQSPDFNKLVEALAGFGFAKYSFRGKNFLFNVMFSSLAIPFAVIVVPLFILMVRTGLTNPYFALIVPWVAPAFGIFMMRQFITQAIPSELLDAGRMDGCTEFGLFWRIVLPLIRPAIGALGVWSFINSYNAFLWPLIIIGDPENYTLPLGLGALFATENRQYDLVLAGSVPATIPSIALFVALRRQLIDGLTAGAVKS